MREGIIASSCGGAILGVDESHVEKALDGVATEPQPERSGRTLSERGEEHAGGHHHERQVPNHVQHQHRPRVRAPVAVVGGNEASEGERPHGGAAEHRIISSAANAEQVLLFLFLLHVRC